jgi:hypothetical protein
VTGKPTTLRIAAGALLAGSARIVTATILGRARPPSRVRITDPEGPPTIDPSGRARSVQAGELEIPAPALDAIWSVAGLAGLGRTYWRFLARISLGLIHVVSTPHSELVVLLGRPLVLLAFDPPEYRLDADRGLIRWPIRGGLLAARGPGEQAEVSPANTDPNGLLSIELRRLAPTAAVGPIVRVEVAVVGFRPAIARVLGRTVYAYTQARIHVAITHAFIRSLAGRPGRRRSGRSA